VGARHTLFPVCWHLALYLGRLPAPRRHFPRQRGIYGLIAGPMLRLLSACLGEAFQHSSEDSCGILAATHCMDVTAMTSVHLIREVCLLLQSVCLVLRVLPLIPQVVFLGRHSTFSSRVLGTGTAPVSGTSRVHDALSLFALCGIKRSALWQVPCQTSSDVLTIMVSTVTFLWPPCRSKVL